MTPRTVTPLVSVVIVMHGGGELLARCVAALRANTREDIEIIVLDSGSPDGTGEWARRALPDVRVHTSTANHGFGAMSNLGVLDARAPYVCFLNADVTVEPNWLPPLLEVMETQPNVGAVAPLLVNPDRSVQEYGSIVRSTGWAQAWTDGPFFRRSVDYSSGACLLVRRNAFHEVGGFSPEYQTAYFEDVDLAFALREKGYATVVEPRSVVVHEMHGISGSDRARKLMELNHGVFATKWSRQLAGHVALNPAEPRPDHLAHARDLTALERILVIDDEIPNADLGVGDPRTHQLLTGLLGRDRLVTFLARMESKDPGQWLLDRGVEVVTGVDDVFMWLSDRLGLFDVVILAHPHNWTWAARAIDAFQPQAKRVYNGLSLHGRRPLPTGSDFRRNEAKAMNETEANAFTWADVAFCGTREDHDWVIEKIAPPTHMHVVGHSAEVVPGSPERSGVAYFGNEEAAILELVSEIWPTLRDWDPDLRLTIVGDEPSTKVAALASTHVKVIGRVPNLPWWLSRAKLHIAPVKSHGLNTWLVASMAAGLPFLTTPEGAEGLHLGDLARHLVSESPADMLKQADKLLTDKRLWRDVSEQLTDLAIDHFSIRAFHRTVDDMLLTCGLAPAER